MDNLPTAYIIIDADEINPAFLPWVDFKADLVANDGDPFGPADYVGHGSEMTMVLNWATNHASYPAAYGHLDQVIAVGARGGYSNAGGEVIFGGVAMFGWPVIGTSVATMEAMGQWVS